jgi:hypothetical protein
MGVNLQSSLIIIYLFILFLGERTFSHIKEALFVFSSGVELKYQNTLELHEIR